MDKYKFSFQIKVTSLLVGSTSLNGTLICTASCDCPTENCRLMLVANPGLKSTGFNVCEIKLISPVSETTTTKTTSQTTMTTTTTTTTTTRPGTFHFFNSVKSVCIVHFIIHITLSDEEMSQKQWQIGVHGRYLMFKGTIKLYYNVLVFSHFYALRMFRFA